MMYDIGRNTVEVYFPSIKVKKDWVGLYINTSIVFRSDYYDWAFAVRILGFGFGVSRGGWYNAQVQKEADEQQPTEPVQNAE